MRAWSQQRLAALTWSIDARSRRSWDAMPPVDRGLASQWYDFAHQHARRMYHDVDIAAEVIAVLSPRNNWQSNLRDATNVLSKNYAASYQAFGPMVQKAQMIQAGFRLDDVLVGPARKVRSFACNIGNLDLCPHEKPCVTVDSWMLRWAGLADKEVERAGVYDSIAQGIRNGAAKLGGLRPFQLQAAIWTQQVGGVQYG